MVDEPDKEPEKEKNPPEFTEKVVKPESQHIGPWGNWPKDGTWTPPITPASWDDVAKAFQYKVHNDLAPKMLSPMSIYKAVGDAGSGGCLGHTLTAFYELKAEEDFINAMLLGYPVTVPRDENCRCTWKPFDRTRPCGSCYDREFWSKGSYITIYNRICVNCVKICFEKGISVRMILANRFVICRKLRKEPDDEEDNVQCESGE